MGGTMHFDALHARYISMRVIAALEMSRNRRIYGHLSYFTESGLGGTRTLNQRLKRALLYH
jgi:hypothetical protein